MSSAERPPSPLHTLRIHQQPIFTVFISSDNERIYSGDGKGRVVITSTRSLRAIADWQAHKEGLLGIEECGDHVITHGRDNKIHIWQRPTESVSIRQGGAASLTDQPPPPLCYSLDVNALNFCRFSLLPTPSSDTELVGLIAVPNLVESALADIWTLPNRTRLHAAIGDPQDTSATHFSDGRSGSKSGHIVGIIMSMHLYYAPLTSPSTSKAQREPRLLCGYEDGGVVLRRRTAPEGVQTVEGKGWEVVWKSRLHVESVMAMAVSKDCSFALTVSADHIVGRYDLMEADQLARAFRTKHPGNSAVAIRGDGRVCAVGGWDGRVRLYSTKSFKPLGALVYHKENCHALAFASAYTDRDSGNVSDGEDDMTNEEKRRRGRWLVTAGKDSRVSIWGLMSFEKGTTTGT
ncbi:WD40-repeat-containing domain protein [Boletus edulis BED1]|uniref:ASTRA-associated protein 1 n=1 Tax=Boletus edulis BED1 TaxID=1328754 RepID=A0AAD4GG14_BOLED|nr:WD40-repeat-containing domain protein [Boletus edulis BED1]